MSNSELRQSEVDKYSVIYTKDPTYRMGKERMVMAKKALAEMPWRHSYLDVGCGRGEMLDYARQGLKFTRVRGTETVPDLLVMGMVEYATVDNLPFLDDAFEVVSMFDVIEHLNEFDLVQACKELERVAKKFVIITASNLPSIERGMDLHITKKPYEEWNHFFISAFKGKVTWRKDLSCRINETWIVEL